MRKTAGRRALRRRTLLLASGLALATGATPAHAQRVPSPYRFIEFGQDLALFGAYVATDRGPAGIGPAPGLAAGVQYTLRINDPMALSARFLFLPTERALVDTATVNGSLRAVREGTADFDLVTFTLRLQFTLTGARSWHGIAPHILAGGGLAVEASGRPAEPTLGPDSRYKFANRFTGELGVGATFFLSDRWAIRAAVLDHLWEIRPPRALGDPAIEPGPAAPRWTHNFEFSAGIAHFF
jgi:hypothetical protein